ncbi:MAG: L-serine ammonia-lyase [Gammaproteobacteria bacterium]|nr:L-serine ammonia-lyase [Gammaproteobacteria bacterium]
MSDISIFDMFSVGIGPSSSHTVGPMRAAHAFVHMLKAEDLLGHVNSIVVELFGSLALTGRGHCTDKAIFMGLLGELPETVDPDAVQVKLDALHETHVLLIDSKTHFLFDPDQHLIFHMDKCLTLHSNGMCFTAYDGRQKVIKSQVYYSIGGGFIVTEERFNDPIVESDTKVPYPFYSAKELRALCIKNKMRIKDIMLANEEALFDIDAVKKRLLDLVQIMEECVHKGCTTEGYLPGILRLKRRAPSFNRTLRQKGQRGNAPLAHLNWINLYALATAEQNAAGGRIVTAPTNGAAGVIPAVLLYYKRFYPDVTDAKLMEFILTAGAIGIIYKLEASISGAEVGCQGEVGVACSMAAGALVAVLGGTLQQIEKAAETAMEHNLGLTCDPVAGLVQIPCIERNAMAAVKAVNAAILALTEGGAHRVSLDEVIITMLETGKAMSKEFKETSKGGLAINVPNC